MTTFPRVGFVRIGGEERRPLRRKGRVCPSGKQRHRTEAGALDALVRVREVRLASPDGRPPENRIYPCHQCDGWHLTSQEPSPYDFAPVRERVDSETWELYARRLERRIAEQRAHIVSLHALGRGAASNKQSRARIAALVVALGQMTERWEYERRNREALVAQLDARLSHRSLLRRLRSRLTRKPSAVTLEAVSPLKEKAS